jgi:DNA-binding IclR family transcriptional regulator
MTDRKHANAAQQRVLLTLNFLASHPEGAFPGEIAKALGTFASNATRDLANLRMAGFAVAVDGRWHCSPKLVGLLRLHDPR